MYELQLEVVRIRGWTLQHILHCKCINICRVELCLSNICSLQVVKMRPSEAKLLIKLCSKWPKVTPGFMGGSTWLLWPKHFSMSCFRYSSNILFLISPIKFFYLPFLLFMKLFCIISPISLSGSKMAGILYFLWDYKGNLSSSSFTFVRYTYIIVSVGNTTTVISISSH